MKGVYSPKQENRLINSNNENIRQIKSISEQQLKFCLPTSMKYKIILRILEISQVVEKIQKTMNSLKILNDIKQEIEILLQKNENERAENILLQRLLNEVQNKIIEIQKRLLRKVTNKITSEEMTNYKQDRLVKQYDLMDLKAIKNELKFKNVIKTQE